VKPAAAPSWPPRTDPSRPPGASGSWAVRLCSLRNSSEELATRLDAFLASPPPGYYPPERLTRTLERVRAQEVEGVVIFSAGGITSAGLWREVGDFFGR